MFDRRRPCATCPFRRGRGSTFRLGRDRLAAIAAAPAFQCHKTVDYSDERPGPGATPQQCAGLMAILARDGRPNQIMQVAERLGALDPAILDPGGVAYRSWDEALAAHDGREPEAEDDRCDDRRDGGETARDA